MSLHTGGWSPRQCILTTFLSKLDVVRSILRRDVTVFWVPAESLGRSSAVGIATTLLAGWCGVQIPVGAGDSSLRQNVQTGSWVLSRGRGVNLTSHLKLVLRLSMSGNASVLYCTVLCCAVLCCAVLCCAALRCAVLCCVVLCCAAL